MSARDSSSQSLIAVAEPGHVLALDGVRGLAILAVLAFHLLMTGDNSGSRILQFLLEVRSLLWVGVTLFFALSGFLITGILYDTLGSEHYFRTFYARRALRIFPLYYGFLFLLLLVSRPFHFDWHGQAWRLLTYTVNIPFTWEWVSNPSPYVDLRHFWSLAVEEQFYLIWPLAIFLLRGWKKVFTAALLGAGLSLAFRISLALRGWAPQNHTLFGTMDALLLGGALALLMRSRFRDAALRLGMPIFLVAMAITLTAAFVQPNFDWWSSTYLTTIGMTVLALGMAALVAASLKRGSITQTLCENPILRFFGRYSYGLYVYHYSLDVALTPPIRRALENRGVPHAIAVLCGALIVGSLSVAIAVLSYKLYEVRFLQLKRFIPNRRHRKRGSEITVPVPLG